MRQLWFVVVALVLSICSMAAQSQTQQLTVSAESTELAANSPVLVTVNYQATDGALTTGLGLRLHFDSTQLSFNEFQDVLTNDKISEQVPVSDAKDFDNDPSTDQFVLVSWASFTGNWPSGVDQPAKLFDASFNASSTFDSSTIINLTASSTASGFTLDAGSLTLTKVLGTESALSDISLTSGGSPLTFDNTFSGSITTYTGTVSFPSNEVSIVPTLADGNASSTVRVNGQEDNDGTLSLAEGANTVEVVVTAENGSASTTYTFDIVRAPALVVDVLVNHVNPVNVANYQVSGSCNIHGAEIAVEVTSSVGTGTASPSVTNCVTDQWTSDAFSVANLSDGNLLITATATTADETATDNNTAIKDITPPSIEAPADLNIEATAALSSVVLGSATAEDARQGAIVATADNEGPFPVGQTTITWSASDNFGNIASDTQRVTVIDSTMPVVTAPADVTAEATGLFSSPAIGIATATDLVDGSLTAVANPSSNFGLGTTEVTWSTTDVAGNTGTATQMVTIEDTTGPVINVPANIQEEAAGTSTEVFLGSASAEDLVSGNVVAFAVNEGPFPLGTTTVTWTAQDELGNTTTATQTVTIADTLAPAVVAPSDITVEATGPTTTVTLGTATAEDLVDGSTAVNADVTGPFAVGTHVITWSSTDTSGNPGSSTQTVIVEDTTAPELTVPESITVAAVDANGTPATASAIAAFVNAATASDLVSGNITQIGVTTPDVFPLGDTEVSFSVIDDNGNQTVKSSIVSVTDQTAPVLTAASNVVIGAGPDGITAEDPAILTLVAGVTALDAIEGPIDAISNNVPSTLPLGDTVIEFTAEDAQGNVGTAQTVVTVVEDLDAPALTAPSAIVLNVFEASDQLLIEDVAIRDFLAAATAIDERDGDLSDAITNDAPEVYPIGEYTVTFSVADTLGNATTATSMISVVIRDTDEDGLPDSYEEAIGLNINDPSDALADLDGDGISNLEEFENNTDATKDEEAPALTIPDDIIIASIGENTPVELGDATAIDNKDGVLEPTPSQEGPFQTGSHDITWSVTDAAGNETTEIQRVTVLPLVTFAPATLATEGDTISVDLFISGTAPEYPVAVSYEVGGTATNPEDHDVQTGTVEITEDDLFVSIDVAIASDEVSETEEYISLTITDVSNAAIGANNSTDIIIVEDNVAPEVNFVVTQNDIDSQIVVSGAGSISVLAGITDLNSGSQHTVDWSATTELTDTDGTADDATFVIDAEGLEAGIYNLVVSVTDDGNPPLTSTESIAINVLEATFTLSDTTDTDGDGTPDSQEGLADSDGDGIADWQDNIDEPNLAPTSTGGATAQTQEGTTIVLGSAALGGDGSDISLTEDEVAEALASVGGVADEDFDFPSGLFDFAISGDLPGASYTIVLPLSSAIPENATYRKFFPNVGWQDFVVDANNSISSAASVENACPMPDSSAFTVGLTEGHDCLQLVIQDGGANDTDGAENGSVADPGGIAVTAQNSSGVAMPNIGEPIESSIQPLNNQIGGGCSLGSSSYSDPVLIILLILTIAGRLKQRLIEREGV